jgi:hypothetical protein
VTGSGKRRVGSVVTEALARRGYSLVMHYRSSAAEAAETAAQLARFGVEVVAIQAEPYAMLRVLDAKDSPIRTILLVEEGKFGAAERVWPFAGQSVEVPGTLLHRDDRWMLELAAESEGIKPTLPLALPEPKRSEPRPVTLRGEIIDSKCYLGAMKPGGGKTHKACAALCIAGGVPPMFVARDGDGKETFYLLTAADGGPIHDAVLPFVGDQVDVGGVVEDRDDLCLLKVAPADIRRR